VSNDFCQKHLEEYKEWLELLTVYVSDSLKLIEPVFVKSLNKDQPGWKKWAESEIGLSKYMLNKVIKDKYNDNWTVPEIVKYLDELDFET
jgi:hypothetical protein